MNPRKQFCYTLPAFYMAAASLYGQAMVIPIMIAPGKVSPVVVNTFQGAYCSLNANDGFVTYNMNLFADDQGQVRFYVQAQAASIAPATLNLQCNPGAVNYTIEISASEGTAFVPAGGASTPTSATLTAETGTVRPPLAGNPLAPSQLEILRRGYPLRPDPVQAPEAYATWLRMVTTPTTLIQPRLIEQRRTFHAAAAPSQGTAPAGLVLPSSATTEWWSGLVLYQDARPLELAQLPPYDVVSGEWFVPTVTGEPANASNNYSASAFWTGLDGWSSNPQVLRDTMQGGTEQDVSFTMAYQGIQFTFTSYYAWAEFFPAPEQLISNFLVSPGDHLVVQVLMEDQNGAVTVNGNIGVCYLQNLTTGYAVWVYLNPPPGITFSGNSAEWVMERPTDYPKPNRPDECCSPGGFGKLANYSAATMLNAYAIRTDSTVVNASGNRNSLNVTMRVDGVPNLPVLSEVVPLNDTSMVFRWQGFF